MLFNNYINNNYTNSKTSFVQNINVGHIDVNIGKCTFISGVQIKDRNSDIISNYLLHSR